MHNEKDFPSQRAAIFVLVMKHRTEAQFDKGEKAVFQHSADKIFVIQIDEKWQSLRSESQESEQQSVINNVTITDIQ